MGVCFDSLSDALNANISSLSISVIVYDGTTNNYIAVDSQSFEVDGDRLLIKAIWSNTQSYDGQVLKGLSIDSEDYNFLNEEIEGGYTYEIKYFINIVDCNYVSC